MQIKHHLKEAGKEFVDNLVHSSAKLAGIMCAFALGGYILDAVHPLAFETDITFADIGFLVGWITASLAVIFERKPHAGKP